VYIFLSNEWASWHIYLREVFTPIIPLTQGVFTPIIPLPQGCISD